MANNILIVMDETTLDLKKFNCNLIIGVERGCLEIIQQKLNLNWAMSDFDKVNQSELKIIKSNAINFKQYDCEKDKIDGEIAIAYAKSLNPDLIICIFNENLRVDLTFSMIYLIEKYNCIFISSHSYLKKIDDEYIIEYEKFKDYQYISIFAINDCSLTIKGLKYETNNLDVFKFDPMLCSNAFDKKQDGIIKTTRPLIIIFSK